MKFNNEYTNFMDKLDTSDEFKSNLIKKIKEEDIKKGVIRMKIKTKINAILAALGIIACSGVAYAAFVPTEIKNTINDKISSFFEIEEDSIKSDIEIQEKTLDEVFTSDKKDIEKYTQLLDADIYGIGDRNGGTLIESNYEQYNWTAEYDEDDNKLEKTLQTYDDIINIKLGQVNYTCLEKLDIETTTYSEDGEVLERKESTIDEILEYQSNEFKQNWNDYYFEENKNKPELYFEITGMLLMNGNNVDEENYYNNSRAKKIKITYNDEQSETINLLDTMEAQYIDLKYTQKDISKPVDISIEILETYDGNLNNDIYIADIQFGISSNITMGR